MLALFSIGLIVGGTVSAMAVWAVSGLVGWVPLGIRMLVLLAAGVVVLLNELGRIRLRLPANHRQVPQDIYANGPLRAALQFGFELGTGVRTYLPSAVPYLLVTALLLLQPSLAEAALAGIAFGLGRAAMAVSRTTSPDSERWDELLRQRLAGSRPAAALTGLAAAAILL